MSKTRKDKLDKWDKLSTKKKKLIKVKKPDKGDVDIYYGRKMSEVN